MAFGGRGCGGVVLDILEDTEVRLQLHLRREVEKKSLFVRILLYKVSISN